MAIDREHVQAWLDAYRRAWQTYDPAAIGDLFSADAEYRYRPWDDGADAIVGRDAIVRAWVAPEGDQSGRDPPGTWDAAYEPYAVDGDRAVAVGWSRYAANASDPERRYHNVFLLEFDPDGRCRRFTELYMLERPND